MLKAKLLGTLALLVSAAHLPADTVTLVTGERLSNVTVRSYDVKEIRFLDDSRRERTMPTWMVAQVRPESVPRRFREGLDALAGGDIENASEILRDFAQRTNPASPQGWMRQLALWNLAQAMIRDGTDEYYKHGVTEISELVKLIPDTAFLPDFYRIRLARHFGSNDAKSNEAAASLISSWMAQIKKEELPEAYLHEATVDQVILERDYKATLKPAAAVARLREVVNLAGDKAPMAVSRANVEIGWSLLLDRQPEEARPFLQEVIQKGLALDMTMARAWLGFGHSYMLKAQRSKDESKLALLAYMRVPVNYKAIGDDFGRGAATVAEALYYAERAYKEWGGPGAAEAERALKAVRKTRYRGTVWGTRD